jgi:hypothetical protein
MKCRHQLLQPFPRKDRCFSVGVEMLRIDGDAVVDVEHPLLAVGPGISVHRKETASTSLTAVARR